MGRAAGWLYYRVGLTQRYDLRWRRLSYGARNLWHELTAWSRDQQTDGRIPFEDLPQIPADPQPELGVFMAELVRADLLIEQNSALFLRGFCESQETKREIQVRRAHQRKWQREHRKRRLQQGKEAAKPLDTVRHDSGMSHALVSGQRQRQRQRHSSEEEKREKGKREKRDQLDLVAPTVPAVGDEPLMAIWNAHRGPLPQMRSADAARRQKLRARWREHPDPAWWQGVITRMTTSPFLTGTNDRGWRAPLTWLIKNSTNALRVLEGEFDAPASAALTPRTERTMAAASAFLRREGPDAE